MKRTFVLIFSYLSLFLHFNIVKTQSNKDEASHKYVKLTKENDIKSKHEDNLKKKSFLQLNSENEMPCTGSECFCKSYYDLTLILDESGSIKKDNWENKVVSFTAKTIDHLNISKDEVHVGIMLFGIKSRDYINFSKDIKYKKEELLKEVEKLKDNYGNSGGTYIVKALEYALKNFTKHKNSRPNAPKVTILFTDGNDSVASERKLSKIGSLYRNENVKLLVVGVAKASYNNLKLIAGCQKTDACPFVMKEEWANLNDITAILTDKICDTGPVPNPGEPEKPEQPEQPEQPVQPEQPEQPVQPEQPEQPEPEHIPCHGAECFCYDYYDLILVLDESASISHYRWKSNVIPFSQELIGKLNISFNKVHIGVILFAEYIRDYVRLSDKVSYEKENLQKKIKELEGDYIHGKKTHIIDALEYVILNNLRYSSRPDAPKVTLLFTDGYDSDQSEDKLYNMGLLYREKNVKLLAIGVPMADENKLRMLVGCNQNEPCPYVVKVEWGNLRSVPKLMIERICTTGPVTPPEIKPPNPETPNSCEGDECFCHNYYDLTLILDESGSIGLTNWKKHVFEFTEKIIENLEVDENKVHIGIFLFAQFNRDFVKFSEEESYKKSNLIQKVKNLENDYKKGGFTYIVKALEYGLNNYTRDPSSRTNAPKVTILFTDGNESHPRDYVLIDVSLLYKKENVKLLVLGVGSATMYKLRLLGGCHKTDGDCPNVLKIDWDKLKDTSTLMIDKVCNTEATGEPEEIPQPCKGDECFCKDYFDLTFIGVPSKQGDYKLQNDISSYAENIMNTFNIGEQNVHAALSIYLGSKTIRTYFDDANTYNKKELLLKLRKFDNLYAMSKTNIAHALEMGLRQSFGNGNRENAPKIALLLTSSDNDISEERMLQQVSNNYIDKRVKLLIIGVGKLPIEKLFIAGGCSLNSKCPNVLQSTNFSYFNTTKRFLEENICSNNVDPVTPPVFSCDDPLCEECDDDLCDNNTLCKKALDIAIVLDQSRNISNEQWKTYVKPFTINTVKQNYLSKYRTHVTIVKMRKHAKEKWSLNRKISYKKNKIIKKIDNLLMSPSSHKDIANTFKYLRTNVFRKTPQYKKKVIIMLIEGKSNTDLNNLRREIELLKINKIDLFVYAIDNIDDNEFKILGNCENSSCKNIVKVSWDNLLSTSDTHMSYICNYYPDDAECTEWGEWSQCPNTCHHSVSKRERKGPYTLKGEGFKDNQHGNSCMKLGSIEYRSCPIKEGCNDICGDFGEWSQCSATCGDGIRIRERIKLSDTEECKILNTTEIESCNVQDCFDTEVCEEIGEWDEWSSCSKTCGYSTRERKFIILPESIKMYPDCKHKEQVEIDVCSVPKCDDDKCFEWGDWSEWSSTCGPRKRVQKAHLNIYLSNINDKSKKSDECEKYYRDKVEYDEELPCTDNPCGKWSEWSECDRTCNAGVRMRHFISHVSAINADNTDECLEYYNSIETEPCLNLPLCNTEECNDWETWIDCKEQDSCYNQNKKIFTRKVELLKNLKNNVSEFCNDYELFKEEECPIANKPCNDALCNEWDEWGDCSATCGTSFKVRTRKEPLELISPSKDINGNMGLTCEQQNIKVEERETCNVPVCAPIIGDTVNSTNPAEGSEHKDNSNKKSGFGTGEKISLAAGVIGLIALATGGLIYGYNTFNGGEVPDTSNMEFENVENNTGEIDETNEDFEVIDANDPMWN
ncbi:circumsporozoite-and TRAP-related protein, putative [Plasmodium relictum]|uniref:Circumsporozoite-and TRAP-related protein, putative n=1 Tax=Plasmodium relictum TaxID=85471 RepID=A0A1J1H1F1_PLARL|nr:circumsporozoite-and TRAP-related protein, putative [Plasmodium relictum]CRG98746.1 circumsporozoite-and TRAP-related protein, putative [Plasmodium relictum]